jgi:hypothetical protein
MMMRRPCGGAGHTTAASNKIPRKGTRTTEEAERFTREIGKEKRASVEVLKPELEELEQTRAIQRSRINKLRYGGQDTWEAAYIEIEEPCDVTAKVDKALKASGFTGKEKRFRELPR